MDLFSIRRSNSRSQKVRLEKTKTPKTLRTHLSGIRTHAHKKRKKEMVPESGMERIHQVLANKCCKSKVGNGPLGPSRPRRQLQRDLDKRHALSVIHIPKTDSYRSFQLYYKALKHAALAGFVSTFTLLLPCGPCWCGWRLRVYFRHGATSEEFEQTC